MLEASTVRAAEPCSHEGGWPATAACATTPSSSDSIQQAHRHAQVDDARVEQQRGQVGRRRARLVVVPGRGGGGGRAAAGLHRCSSEVGRGQHIRWWRHQPQPWHTLHEAHACMHEASIRTRLHIDELRLGRRPQLLEALQVTHVCCRWRACRVWAGQGREGPATDGQAAAGLAAAGSPQAPGRTPRDHTAARASPHRGWQPRCAAAAGEPPWPRPVAGRAAAPGGRCRGRSPWPELCRCWRDCWSGAGGREHECVGGRVWGCCWRPGGWFLAVPGVLQVAANADWGAGSRLGATTSSVPTSRAGCRGKRALQRSVQGRSSCA